MDFSLTEEQVLLQDSVARYVVDHGGVERHRQLQASGQGFDPKAWQLFAELGWLGLPFSEDLGGLGGGSVDMMMLAEAMGRGLIREPYLATVVTCGSLLSRGASADQQQRYLPGIIDGTSQWAFAFAEASGGYRLSASDCTARAVPGGFQIDGEKIAVLNGDCADYLIVNARSAEDPEAGDSLYIVDASLAGVSRQAFAAVDGSRGAAISFSEVVVDQHCLLGEQHKAAPLISHAVDAAIVFMGGESLGAVQTLLDNTVEYTRTREQFGQPIGKFQALQHRMAEMYLKVEELRSLCFYAAIAMDEQSPDTSRACASLKVKLAEAGRYVSQEAVQLHGGIGMSDELIVGHLFKRLLLLAKLYGDEDFYLQRYMLQPAPAALAS